MGANEPVFGDNPRSDRNNPAVCDPVSEPMASANTFSNVGGAHKDVSNSPNRDVSHKDVSE